MSLSFERIRPALLFHTEWRAKDLDNFDDQPGTGDLVREVNMPPSTPSFFFGHIGRSKTVEHDNWGSEWAAVPSEDWNEDLSDSILDYETLYLQLRVTVAKGISGDSILFGFNEPGTKPSEGIHAYAHLQVPPFEGDQLAETHEAVHVSRHFVGGYGYTRDSGDPLATVRADTLVALYGVGRTPDIRITAEAVVLGGLKG